MQPTDAPHNHAGAHRRRHPHSFQETGSWRTLHAAGYVPFLHLPPEVPAGRTGQGRPRKASRVSTSPPGGCAWLYQPPFHLSLLPRLKIPPPSRAFPRVTEDPSENTGLLGRRGAWLAGGMLPRPRSPGGGSARAAPRTPGCPRTRSRVRAAPRRPLRGKQAAPQPPAVP